MLAIAYFSIKLARYTFIFWGPKFVAESLGSNAAWSTITAAALPVGGVLGVIGIGYVFQARRAPATVISLLITAGIMLVGLAPIHDVCLMGEFFLPGVITTETDWSGLFGVILVGLIISAIVLLPLWRTKPPTADRK